MHRIVLTILVVALAGCTQGTGPKEIIPAGPTIEGWVTTPAQVPIEGATVAVAGQNLSTVTDREGHYSLVAPPGMSLVITATAQGYLPASRATGESSGARHTLNFTLQNVPTSAPYSIVEKQEGFIQCAITAVVLEDQGSPHSHQGANCSTAVNDTRNIWHNAIPNNASGLVMELQWKPNSELAQGLVMKIVVDGSDDILGFVEGRSIVRVHVSQDKLQENLNAGHSRYTVTITPGAGTGEHEHGAIGVFIEQPFTIYATTFFNGPVDPAYSIANRDP